MLARRELKKMAKEQIQGNVLILAVMHILTCLNVIILLLGIVLFIVPSIVSIIQSPLFKLYLETGDPYVFEELVSVGIDPFLVRLQSISSISELINWFVLPALVISLYYIYIEVTKGKKPEFSMLFDGFKTCWGRSILLNLLKKIFLILWSLLFFIPGIIKFYSYSMAEFIMAENPSISALDAITESKEMMKGHKFELFVLHLSFFWWYLLAGITFGIAYIYVLPYVTATKTNFYLKLKEEQAETK